MVGTEVVFGGGRISNDSSALVEAIAPKAGTVGYTSFNIKSKGELLPKAFIKSSEDILVNSAVNYPKNIETELTNSGNVTAINPIGTKLDIEILFEGEEIDCAV